MDPELELKTTLKLKMMKQIDGKKTYFPKLYNGDWEQMKAF